MRSRGLPEHAASSLWLAVLWTVSTAAVTETAPLPEPLTLGYALSLADEPHPTLQRRQAAVARSRAEQLAADASDGLEASFAGRLSGIVPSQDFRPIDGDWRNDNFVGLLVRKRLYDFGATGAREAAAMAVVREQEAELMGARQARRIEVARRFFDVLLADLQFARDNEDMAVAFVRLDRIRDRHRLGQVSELALLQAESTYQTIRRERAASQAAQRATRSLLALALNRPGHLSADLVPPALPGNDRPLPELAELESAALERGPRLQALRSQVEASQKQIEAARGDRNPVITGEMEAAEYSLETRTRPNFRIGVLFEMPLYTGGRTDAELARRQAELSDALAELSAEEYAIRQAVLSRWLELQTLYVQRDEAQALTAFTDMSLDRNRLLYEMEVSADLGDAMVRTSGARLRRAQTEYAIALTWAELGALTGVGPQAMVEQMLKGPSR
jgi:outer membrane protein TolC